MAKKSVSAAKSASSARPARMPEPAAGTAPAATHLRGKAVVHSSKVAYQGRIFSVVTDHITEPGGVTGTRDFIRHNGSIVVLAVDSSTDPADPVILLERQYRHAAGKFLLELPAGRIEPGEAPLAAAKRELIEETGFRAKKWSRLVQYYASPGFLSEYFHVFLAEDLQRGKATPEEDEKIELIYMPISKLLAQIYAGKIHDGKTITAALLYSARNRANVR